MVRKKMPNKVDCRACKWKGECVNVDEFDKDECLQYEQREIVKKKGKSNE